MSSYGVTTTGFVVKDTDTINSEIGDEEKNTITSALNLQADSSIGQVNGIMAAKLNEVWELGQAIYRAFQPDYATGDALDNISAITGVTRLPAQQSTTTLTLNLDAGTTVPSGSLVSSAVTGVQFETTAGVTNGGAGPANVTVAAQSVLFDAVSAPAGTLDTIDTPVAGWTANAGITSGSAETYALSDGLTLTVKVDNGSEQTATFNTADFADIANATAAEVAAVIDTDITGATSFDSGGSVRIESDTVGLNTAIQVTGGTANGTLGFSTTTITAMNQADAVLGRLEESDQDLRLRREELLTVGGKATINALRSALLDVDGVTAVNVFENATLVTDAFGVPGKAFESVVSGSFDNQDVIDAIGDTKPLGIQAYGTDVSGTFTDSQGFTHTIEFSFPTEIEIWLSFILDTDALVFGGGDAAAGRAAVRSAVVSKAEMFQSIGDDVVALRYKCVPLEIVGVNDVTNYLIDTSDPGPPAPPPPDLEANISIASRETAIFAVTRIYVNGTLS